MVSPLSSRLHFSWTIPRRPSCIFILQDFPDHWALLTSVLITLWTLLCFLPTARVTSEATQCFPQQKKRWSPCSVSSWWTLWIFDVPLGILIYLLPPQVNYLNRSNPMNPQGECRWTRLSLRSKSCRLSFCLSLCPVEVWRFALRVSWVGLCFYLRMPPVASQSPTEAIGWKNCLQHCLASLPHIALR